MLLVLGLPVQVVDRLLLNGRLPLEHVESRIEVRLLDGDRSSWQSFLRNLLAPQLIQKFPEPACRHLVLRACHVVRRHFVQVRRRVFRKRRPFRRTR